MTLAAKQAQRILTASRRLRDTPGHNQFLEEFRQRKHDVFREMLGAAPTNGIGLSSTVHGTGAFDTTETPLLKYRTRQKKKLLRAILPDVFKELVGSVNDPGVPKNPIMSPGSRKPRRRKTKVIFNPTLKA